MLLQDAGHNFVTLSVAWIKVYPKMAYQENILQSMYTLCVASSAVMSGWLHSLKREKKPFKNNMPYSHEQMWLAAVVSVIMTFTAAAGRPICADVQYSPAASLTPASLLIFSPSLPALTLFFSSFATTHFATHLLLSCVSWLLSFCHPSHGLWLRCSPQAFSSTGQEHEKTGKK